VIASVAPGGTPIAPGGTPPSIPAIAARRVLIAVAHPRIAAGLEALLDAEHRYHLRRASSGADLAAGADAVIADAAFLDANGAPAGVPAVVLLDPSADRGSLEARVPFARAWLTTSATGEELIAALDGVLAAVPMAVPPVVHPAAVHPAAVHPAAAPPVPTRPAPTPPVLSQPAAIPVARARVEPAPAEPADAAPATAGWTLSDIAGIALVVFGVACGVAGLAFLWMLVRP
jgi:hypothetical protein